MNSLLKLIVFVIYYDRICHMHILHRKDILANIKRDNVYESKIYSYGLMILLMKYTNIRE